ncbi:MAG: AAA family ATPase [Lachnospiraceae bacterium]|nr:AAA family ATPase [Lachnospiraceae bacterium]
MKDDFMSSGSGSRNYTADEIDRARKMQKKNGGTLMDNLAKLTGRGMPSTTSMADLTSMYRKANQELSSFIEADSKRKKEAEAKNDAVRQQLMENQEKLNKALDSYTNTLKEDFGIEPQQDNSWMNDFGIPSGQNSTGVSGGASGQGNLGAVEGNGQTGAGLQGTYATDNAYGTAQPGTQQAAKTEEELASTREVNLEKFNGLADEINKTVFGQEEFVKKLVIAFKRPLVMPPENPKALNTILLTGKKDTGKHFALTEIAKELNKRGILRNSDIRVLDLGLYTDASMEKLFLQDIFSALSCNSRIVLFENFENCHPSFLSHISSLVIDGRFQLSERYIFQKGQLVNVQNSLASEAVSAFTANGKYLIFITEKTLDKCAGIMGAPFINALGDVCTTKELEAIAIRKIAEGELEDLKNKAANRFFFKLDFDEGFLDYSVSRSERQAGLRGVQDFYDSVLQALAQAKLEGDYPKDAALKLGVAEGRINAKYDEELIDLSALLPEGFRGEIEEIKKEMDAIVGLAKVKEYVFSLEEYYKVQKRRQEEGLKTSEVSKHMIFTGSPGTGKTTIARIISKYLKAIGVLTGGQLVEVSRADLVGRYVGHTAPLTNQVISSAIGGVLFIDEAYSLYRGKDDSFGLEAIDTLVKGIEDNRENLIVILAGYSNEMQEFLTSNSGLKSRFPNVINFPDYTGEELLKIAKSIAKSKGYTIDEGADPALTTYFNAVQMVRAADAGNGRLARNKIEEAILNQSKRLVAEPNAELSVLMSEDFDLNDVMSDEK